MKDYKQSKRTLHNEFYPPKQRLKYYGRKQLIEEKEEFQKEQIRIIKEKEIDQNVKVGELRKEMVEEWKYVFNKEVLDEDERERMEFELKQKIKKCKKKKKRKKKLGKKKDKKEPPLLTPDYIPFRMENQYFKQLNKEVGE